jgi:hypothetical protein
VIARRDAYFKDLIYDLDFDSSSASSSRFQRIYTAFARRANCAFALSGLIKECDAFLFMWGDSLLPFNLDYPILKRAKKKLITAFLGSDVRYWQAFEQEMESLDVADEIRPFLDYLKTSRYRSHYAIKKHLVDYAERYADLILSQPGLAQLQSRPYMRFNIPLDLSQYRFNIPNREIPLLLHAPSNRGIKGTTYVFEAIQKLKEEGLRFEFRLIENMQNYEIRDLLSEADIVIDELFAETVAVLSTEAMASGTVTLVRYMPEYAKVPPGCPAVNVTKDTLVEKLREIILDRNLRKHLAELGLPYVKANNDHIAVTRQILSWLEGEIEQYDFIPTFYQHYHK